MSVYFQEGCLKEVIVSDFSGVLLTIFTALLGGGVSSAIMTSFLEGRRTEKAVLRLKLEELYTEFDKQARSIVHVHRMYKHYAEGRTDVCQFLDEVKELTANLPQQTVHRIESLSAIYFPEVTLVYRSFLTARSKFSEVAGDVDELIINSSVFRLKVFESYEYLQEMDRVARGTILKCAIKINRPFFSV